MELRLSKEQLELQQAVRRFAETEVASAVPLMEQHDQFPSLLIEKLSQAGFMGIPIPKQWGGAGCDFISYIAAVNEISKISAALGVILSVHTSVCTLPILHYGTQAQISSYVPKLASGERLGAFALTEPHAGSDASSIRTTAVLDGEYYVLNGSKVFITNAGAANVYVAFAVTDASKGAYGITAFIIESETKGLTIGRKEKKLGLHGSNTCELIFDQLRIPVSHRLGEEGKGFSIAKGSLDGGRIGISAQALGIAQAALNILNDRFQPKAAMLIKPDQKAMHQQVKLAGIIAKVEAARLLVYRAAYLHQEGLPCTKEASMAKMFASDTAVAVTSQVMQMLGSDSCLQGSTIERLFRDAKATQIYEGTNEIHRIVISGKILKSL
ncbi:acyl-CoA dehydrogenase family protein [Paenibacillus sp. 2TAB26]|uniref:acyl-CoA dehydrogenase family protein n=1 Tax=Paenibacillus sp. 2TAB26 TaxID=3233005 RepID=UPI003F9CE922